MKLIVCSIGVLVVTGVISLAIAPVLSLAQSTQRSGFSIFSDPPVTGALQNSWFQRDAQTRSALQAVLIPVQRMELETASTWDTSSQKTPIALNLSPLQQTEWLQILLLNQSPPAKVLTPIQIEEVRRSLPFKP